MEKSPTPELSKITDYFSADEDHVKHVKDSSKELTPVSKDQRRLEDILPTPESSPVKDETQTETGDRATSDKAIKGCRVRTVLLKEGKKGCEQVEETVHHDSLSETKEQETKASDCQPDTPKDIPKDAPLTPRPGTGRGGKKKRGKKTASAASTTTVQPTILNSPVPTKPKSSRRKKTDPAANNHVLTDYFPIRRSGRQCISQIKKDEQNRLEDAILNGKEEGLEVVEFEGKGRGVLATRAFRRGEFVVEYAGDLIDLTSAKERDAKYAASPKEYGCYMYYFTHKNKNYCIDATLESDKLGRLLNHSKKGNCHTKLIDLKDRPYLILVASQDIKSGEELVYDYGDRSKTSLEAHPWLAS